METDRKQKREFGVYDQEKNKFYNMDFTSILEDQYHEDIPKKGYTYEEAQRFIIHCDNKSSCKIVNIKQPKYLLDFEMEFYRKEQSAKEAKENIRFISNIQHTQAESNTKRQNKERYFSALGKYRTESLRPIDGVRARQLEESKPKMKDYELTSNDFDSKEKNQLISYYGVPV